MSFQFNSKSIFLTVPQCDTTLVSFINEIETFFGDNLDKCIACQERHQDGNLHLHAAICLKKAHYTRDPKFLDHLAGVHPNISGRFKGGLKKAFQYVMKDGEYLTLPPDLDLETLLTEKKGNLKTQKIVDLIHSGAGEDVIDDVEPAYMLMHLQQVQRYLSFCELKKRRAEFAGAQDLKVHVAPAEGYSSVWNTQIASWLNRNIRQKRSHRQKQLWVKAPPAAGKTTTLLNLEKDYKLSIYWWPRDEKWWDGYSDGAFDLIVLDEYRAQKMITELNPILSGDPTPLSRRNAPPLVKRDILPVIIFANTTPEESYHKCDAQHLAPLLDRLTVVEVPPDGLVRIENCPNPVYPTDDETPSAEPPRFAPPGISAINHSYSLFGREPPMIRWESSSDDEAEGSARWVRDDATGQWIMN
jgi:hypothetical protein